MINAYLTTTTTAIIAILLLLPTFNNSIGIKDDSIAFNVFTDPSVVYVGDTFIIGMVVSNRSDSAIQFNGLCYSPLNVIIENTNIVKEAYLPKCLAFETKILEPNATAIVYSDPGIRYIAVNPGYTKLSITFEYSPSCAEECKNYKHIEYTVNVLPTNKGSIRAKLNIGDTLMLDDTTLKVIDIEDSRCALDVVCIWEGRAVARLSLNDSNDSSEYELSINDSMIFKDYHVRLLSIEPYPIVGEGKKGKQALLEVSNATYSLKTNAKIVGDKLVMLVYNNLNKDINSMDLMIVGKSIKDIKAKGGSYTKHGTLHFSDPIRPNHTIAITIYTEGEGFSMQGRDHCCIYNEPISIILKAKADTGIDVGRGLATPVSYSILSK
jgi:hypothetical protein